MTEPKVLALDFDGVICDSVREGLRSAWRVYRDIWGGANDSPPPDVAAAYLRLRPSLEIGWEFPIMLRAIVEGVPEADLLREFQTTWRSRIVQAHHLDPGDLSARFDAARDAWIRADLSGWLASQHFYPGVADRLRAILQGDTRLFVITTKEWRYAHLLLERNRVPLAAAHVWGKERVRPKADLLRILRQENGVDIGEIWFVEDRLKTLRAVRQQADLEAMTLFLAAWGYNTPSERDEARADRRIIPLTLEQFCRDFPDWMRPMPGDRSPRGVVI